MTSIQKKTGPTKTIHYAKRNGVCFVARKVDFFEDSGTLT